MKKFILFAVTSALGLAAPAAAAVYDFKYTFNTGEVITGRVDGVMTNGVVTGLSNISMSLNGVAFAGPLYAYGNSAVRGDGQECGSPACFTAPAAMSSDPLLNDFFITTAPTAAGLPGGEYFYIMPWASGNQGLGAQAYFKGSYYNFVNRQYVPGNWSLVAEAVDPPVSAIPEPGTWAMMILGFGLVGSMARRRGAPARVTG